jgi:hypothetical protein
MDPVDIVKKTYDDTFLAEWERLDRHPFEFELNKRFILRYIKPGIVFWIWVVGRDDMLYGFRKLVVM